MSEVHGLLDGGVAATDNVDLEVLEEAGVACGAEGNAATDELLLVLAADGTRVSAQCKNDCLGLVVALGTVQGLDIAVKLDGLDGVALTLSTKLLDLRGHASDKARTGLALKLGARIVLDLVGDGNLATILTLLDDQGIKTVPPGVDASGQASGASSKNDQVVDLTHYTLLLPLNNPD